MPEGFTDRAAWDAIHWRFGEHSGLLDEAVMDWQLLNQHRVSAANRAAELAITVKSVKENE